MHWDSRPCRVRVPKNYATSCTGWSREWTGFDDVGKGLRSQGYPDVPQVTFLSDTIVVGMPNIIDAKLKKTDLDYSVHSLSLAATLAGEIMLMAGNGPIPMAYRGCISFGEYEMDGRFILGPAVNDAAEHYELGESAAVWLTPTALALWNKAAPQLDSSTARSLRPCAVPLKTGGTFVSVAANPFYNHKLSRADRQRWIQSVLSSFSGPISVHVKRQNTEKALADFDAETARWTEVG